jgi:hypothetical protein
MSMTRRLSVSVTTHSLNGHSWGVHLVVAEVRVARRQPGRVAQDLVHLRYICIHINMYMY